MSCLAHFMSFLRFSEQTSFSCAGSLICVCLSCIWICSIVFHLLLPQSTMEVDERAVCEESDDLPLSFIVTNRQHNSRSLASNFEAHPSLNDTLLPPRLRIQHQIHPHSPKIRKINMRVLSVCLVVSSCCLLSFIASSAALPTGGELVDVIVLDEDGRMEKSLGGNKQRMNPYEDDEFDETAHGLMSDTGSSVKSYMVDKPVGEDEPVKKSSKKSAKSKNEDESEEDEEPEDEIIERKDTKKSDVQYTYDPEYLEQGYLLPVTVKDKKKGRKGSRKNKKGKKDKYEAEESEEEDEEEQGKRKKNKKKNKDEESEEDDVQDEEGAEEDEEEDDEPSGNKKKDEPPQELIQTLLDTYGFVPQVQGQQGGQQGGPQGGRPQGGGGRPQGHGGRPNGPPGGGQYGGPGGPDGPHYDFPPSRTPGAKYDYGTAPPNPEQGNYGNGPPQGFGPSSQEQQPSLISSMLSRFNPFKRGDQQQQPDQYGGGPNGPPQNGQYGGGPNGPPQNGQYGGGPNGPPQGQYGGPPQHGQYGPPPNGHYNDEEGPPRRPPPPRKNKNKNKYRGDGDDMPEGPQNDYNGNYEQGPPNHYEHGPPQPYDNNYDPNASSAEIKINPFMSRLSSVFGMGSAKKTNKKEPFISISSY